MRTHGDGLPRTRLPRARAPEPASSGLDACLLGRVLAAAAAAPGAGALAEAVVRRLATAPGVRGALLVTGSRREQDLLVLGSAGYDCPSMAVGARLPRSAGLPVTEAVRTGRTVVCGDVRRGPSWVAVPLPRAGNGRAALLLSLFGPPADAALLAMLADGLGCALDRAVAADAQRAQLAVLTADLAPRPPRSGHLDVRTLPYRGELTGDVVASAEVAGTRCLLVADVCGRGPAAAVMGTALRAAFAACLVPGTGPAAVLAGLERALCGAGPWGEESFATALVVQLADDGLTLASAGHPLPLLRAADGAVATVLAPCGPPLGLGLGTSRWHDSATAPAPACGALVCWTDGLLDRDVEVDLALVLRDAPTGGVLAEQLERGCGAHGPRQDDATVVVWTL